jgi:hypothetical protein
VHFDQAEYNLKCEWGLEGLLALQATSDAVVIVDILSFVEGFRADPKDFNIAIENHKTGAGVRLTGDQPLWRINFWSIRNTVCPEAYVEVKADPGKETSWRLTYDFYVVPAGNRAAAPISHTKKRLVP